MLNKYQILQKIETDRERGRVQTENKFEPICLSHIVEIGNIFF